MWFCEPKNKCFLTENHHVDCLLFDLNISATHHQRNSMAVSFNRYYQYHINYSKFLKIANLKNKTQNGTLVHWFPGEIKGLEVSVHFQSVFWGFETPLPKYFGFRSQISFTVLPHWKITCFCFVGFLGRRAELTFRFSIKPLSNTLSLVGRNLRRRGRREKLVTFNFETRGIFLLLFCLLLK